MIAVLDFGGQYANMIARRLRDLHVNAKVFPHDVNTRELADVSGIIFSGGPSSVNDVNAPKPDDAVFKLGKPILGLCYGHQYIAHFFGGRVEKLSKEYGEKTVKILKKQGVLKGLKDEETVWFSHWDSVLELPKGFEILAKSGQSVSAFQKGDLYGVQFHPEVDHTPCGSLVLQNFAFSVCAEQKAENPFKASELVKDLSKKMPSGNVVVAVSGGVDSTVAAVLLHKAIGDRLFPVFVDTGFMRKNESNEVKEFFKDYKNFKIVDASKEFLEALKAVSEPEQKRKIIGHLFIRTFEKSCANLKNVAFLAQGTIYSDRVESAATSKASQKIKSHHNLTLPDVMKWPILEPLAEMYKDEVRTLGKELGIQNERLYRQPFPGPGLAINVVGEVTADKIRIVRESQAIFDEELKKAGIYDKIFQSFTAVFPCKVVGVKGDERSYEYPVALRAVESKDVMTADWVKIPYDVLQTTSTRIINEVQGVNRVLYDVTQKPPGTIMYE